MFFDAKGPTGSPISSSFVSDSKIVMTVEGFLGKLVSEPERLLVLVHTLGITEEL